MLLRASVILAAALLGAAGAASAIQAAPRSASYLNPSAWVIGPIIRGQSRSRGMPLHPSPGPGRGWHFEFPQAPGSVHYVTFRHGSLAGKSRIVMRYRIEAATGVRIVPRSSPASPSILTLYFQRAGDTWRGRGPFEAFRWYATFASQMPIVQGEHVIVAPLNANWTAVQTSSARTNPAAFRDAIANADQVGFVLGGGDGFGHGVYATGPARIVVTDFRVE